MLVVLEGCNGVGKTTMCRVLGGRFKSLGHEVTHVREPGTTDVGEAIRPFVREKTAEPLSNFSKVLMCLASRAECISQVIGPALNRKEIVIADRFAPSTIVYQYCLGPVNSEMFAPIDRLLDSCIAPQESKTFVLDAPIEILIERSKQDSENVYRNQSADYIQDCRKHYLSLAEEKNYTVIDATKSLCEQSKKIMDEVLPSIYKPCDIEELTRHFCS